MLIQEKKIDSIINNLQRITFYFSVIVPPRVNKIFQYYPRIKESSDE